MVLTWAATIWARSRMCRASISSSGGVGVHRAAARCPGQAGRGLMLCRAAVVSFQETSNPDGESTALNSVGLASCQERTADLKLPGASGAAFGHLFPRIATDSNGNSNSYHWPASPARAAVARAASAIHADPAVDRPARLCP